MTQQLARAAGTDAANAQMRKAGRTAWSTEDYDLAVSTFRRLWPDPFEGKRFRLVNRKDGQGDQTPPRHNYGPRPASRVPVSVAEVRRRLPVGTEFTGEFIGINAKNCRPGMQVTRRRVVKNSSHELESVMLNGPQKDGLIHLNWKHVAAGERDGNIILTMTETKPPEKFLKITL